MKLEDVSAVLRPRRSWEAVDLGCALVKRHSRKIYGAWMVTVFPLFVFIAVLLWSHPVWALMLIVFLKPLADRVPLYVISRGMFGDAPSIREVFRAFPGMLWRNAGVLLFTNRLALNRCFVMPVIELEASDRKIRKERISALGRLSDVAGSVSFFSGVIEMCMLISLIVFTIAFIPESMTEEMSWSWLEFQLTSSLGDLTPVLQFILIYQIIVTTLVEPFYVGAGFGLYLNARSILEGWDVELSFRRIAKRLEGERPGVGLDVSSVKSGGSGPRVLLGMLVVFLVLSTSPSRANEDSSDEAAVGEAVTVAETAADDRKTAEEILAGPEFEVKTNKVWVPADEEVDDMEWQDAPKGGGMPGFSNFLEFVFWVLIIAASAVIVYYIVTALRGKKTLKPASAPKPEREGITTYQGMNIAPQSLPYDIAAAARNLWNDGRQTEALGLLYRGAISWMVHAASLAIEESFTEGDCQRMVNRSLPQSEEAGYFDRLTGNWVMTAYAQMPPSDEEFSRLCDAWPYLMTQQPNGRKRAWS